jgi:hypothetical protein
MGTLIATPQARASFQQQIYPAGLDLNRCEIHRSLGVWRANAGASFRAGAPVMLNSAGEVVLSDGTALLGVAKWDKITQKRTVVVDFPVTFGVAGATKNLKPNIIGSSNTVNTVQVASALLGGGTQYAVTTDFTLNIVNGTITQVPSGSGGSIDPTHPVYVTYSRTLTETELLDEGHNFWQSLDYVTIQDLRIAVIEAPAQIFTTEYDTEAASNVIYSLTGANSNVYVNSAGLFTTNSSSARLCGTVISVPTAGDPWLGIDFRGSALVNS